MSPFWTLLELRWS